MIVEEEIIIAITSLNSTQSTSRLDKRNPFNVPTVNAHENRINTTLITIGKRKKQQCKLLHSPVFRRRLDYYDAIIKIV